MKADRKKRRSSGMSLSEVLVALLIFSLVAAAMSAGIGAALRVYSKATQSSEAQMLCSTISQAVTDILRSSRDAADSDTAPTVSNDLYGENKAFSVDNGQICFGGKRILGSGAYTNLSASMACSCADSVFTVTVTISDSGGKELANQTFSVRVPEQP